MHGLILGFADIEAARAMHGLVVEPGPKRAEVALWTDDVDTAYERIPAGATSLSPPHEFIGRRAAWVSDPDGGLIQLVSEIARRPCE